METAEAEAACGLGGVCCFPEGGVGERESSGLNVAFVGSLVAVLLNKEGPLGKGVAPQRNGAEDGDEKALLFERAEGGRVLSVVPSSGATHSQCSREIMLEALFKVLLLEIFSGSPSLEEAPQGVCESGLSREGTSEVMPDMQAPEPLPSESSSSEAPQGTSGSGLNRGGTSEVASDMQVCDKAVDGEVPPTEGPNSYEEKLLDIKHQLRTLLEKL